MTWVLGGDEMGKCEECGDCGTLGCYCYECGSEENFIYHEMDDETAEREKSLFERRQQPLKERVIEAVMYYNSENELRLFWSIIADELNKKSNVMDDWVIMREETSINVDGINGGLFTVRDIMKHLNKLFNVVVNDEDGSECAMEDDEKAAICIVGSIWLENLYKRTHIFVEANDNV
jgi:hypothetical protein